MTAGSGIGIMTIVVIILGVLISFSFQIYSGILAQIIVIPTKNDGRNAAKIVK